MRRLHLISGLLVLCSLLASQPLQAKPPVILVTIKPVHSLVTNLTRGVSRPELLIQGTQSPHDYALKPSERRLFNDADLIIYVSPAIEGFMQSLETRLDQHKLVALARLPGIRTLPARAQHESHEEHHHDSDLDGHIWLSTENAATISRQIHQRLVDMDRENQATYTANLERLLEQLQTLHRDIERQLSPLRDRPFMIYHDAFQYFEQEFGLSNAIFVTPSPEQQPGIRQVTYLRSIIRKNNLKCIYFEPPYMPGIIKTITEGQEVSLLPLDPSGALLAADEQMYFTLMRTIAHQLSSCLGEQH